MVVCLVLCCIAAGGLLPGPAGAVPVQPAILTGPRVAPAALPCGGGHTLVIGAGAAGLAAAHLLRAHNCSVTVLEARARIGGRSYSSLHAAPHTAASGGHAGGRRQRDVFDGIDRGAHWVHGGRANPITSAYLDYFGIERVAQGGDSSYEGLRERLCVYEEGDAAGRRAAGGGVAGAGGWVSREQLDASFDVFAYEVALAETYFRLRRHSRVCAGGLVCFRCARVNTCRLRAYMHAQRMCIHSYMYIYTYNIDTYR
jgi:hypothetical protein